MQTPIPPVLLRLDDIPEADRRAHLRHLCAEDRLHIPLGEDARLTERDRVRAILDLAGKLQARYDRQLGKHELRHLMVPDRDDENDAVIDTLRSYSMPGRGERSLTLVLAGPNSTGKSLLAAHTVVRLLGSEAEIVEGTETFSGVVRCGVYCRAARVLDDDGRPLTVTYQRQRVITPSLDDVEFARDTDVLAEIRRSFDDPDPDDLDRLKVPDEAQQVRRLAGKRVVVIDDFGQRDGGKPDFPRRVWADFLDQRESMRGAVTVFSTNLDPDELTDHIGYRGSERLAGMVERHGAWIDLRGRSRRRSGAAGE